MSPSQEKSRERRICNIYSQHFKCCLQVLSRTFVVVVNSLHTPLPEKSDGNFGALANVPCPYLPICPYPVSSIYIWSKNFSHSAYVKSEAKDGGH